ncbi:hypothetical protein Hypma_003822 [Hypsizygus marmoreus]|uniref:Uncharacterized protein n=1 Tax=Hypsizygus marmoreus TaxID=39966 RepID=A0A369K4A2_HYPMA|nr:hypothetical protein Hypma_003822 [Hypsizygus marmoreus]
MTSNLEQEEVSLPDNWTVCVKNDSEAFEYDALSNKYCDGPIDAEMSSILTAIHLLDANTMGMAVACSFMPTDDLFAEPMPVIHLTVESLEVLKTAPTTQTPVHIYISSTSQWHGGT